MREKENIEKVRGIYEAMDKGDFTALISLMAEDGSVWLIGSTPMSGLHQGKEKIEALFKQVSQFFCNGIHFNIKHILAEGNVVMAEWEDWAIVANGKRYENNGVNIFVFNKEGKIQSFREYIDPEKIMQVM
ncbi:MAG: hypothetical protein A3G93_12200 [Nitrospinae bacterium RIFCSPLOWO2_12_FULL_45_22]|nr:MAG: hypothetical protein A3G93_12200 [Nitrospinae bacterium RIFCSPLOWO2_12_FULL_45_22]